jgi:DNA-binding LytR/AlgR family response regulator
MDDTMTSPALRVLVVEDEVLIALELECLLDELGHDVVGVAGSSAEAIALGIATAPDVAFMTANAKRIPDDFAGAMGVIAKPYSERVVAGALRYVADLRAGRAATIEGLDGFRLAIRDGAEPRYLSEE